MCKTWQSFGGVAAQCVESHKNSIKHHNKNAEFIHPKKKFQLRNGWSEATGLAITQAHWTQNFCFFFI